MITQQIKTDDVIEQLGVNQPESAHKWKLLMLVFIVIAGVAVYILMGQSDSNSGASSYETEKLIRGDLTIKVTATGTLQPTNEVEVGSELSGIIKTVEVDYNGLVKKGQILATLDTQKIDAQVTQSKATLSAAKAKVLQTEATEHEAFLMLEKLKKLRSLSNGMVPAQSDLDSAVAALERAKADQASAVAAVTQAQATLDTYETDRSKTFIRSPIDGIVLTRDVEPGQTVAAALQAPVLFTLAEDLAKMELHVDVDEADIGRVQADQFASFVVAAYPDRNFEARIIQTRYGASNVSGVVTYETVLGVNNKDFALRPGMTATADIVVQEIKDALLVPSAAMRFAPAVKEEKSESQSFLSRLIPHPPRRGTNQKNTTDSSLGSLIYLLENGMPKPVTVKLGATYGSFAEVLEGDVKVGDLVITAQNDTE